MDKRAILVVRECPLFSDCEHGHIFLWDGGEYCEAVSKRLPDANWRVKSLAE